MAHITYRYIPETVSVAKVGTISSRPASRLGGVNTAGMDRLEARKLQMLVSQRKKLEEELLMLEDEILNTVRMNFWIRLMGLTIIQERKPLPKTRK